MKTIEEAAKDIFPNLETYFSSYDNRDIKQAIHFGVEYTQRWIPIEEELPPIGVRVIMKYKDYESEDYYLLTYSGNINQLSFITHWRLIEVK